MKEENIIEAGICRIAAIEGLKSVSISFLIEDDIV